METVLYYSGAGWRNLHPSEPQPKYSMIAAYVAEKHQTFTREAMQLQQKMTADGALTALVREAHMLASICSWIRTLKANILARSSTATRI